MPQNRSLSRYLTPVNVWALSFGCILGWGAFVMPGSTLLPIAGPVGSIIAMAVGTVIMGIIAVSFHFMAKRYPDSGGAYTYAKKVLGYDHAFLCGWSLVLAYIAIIWANATAVVLIARFLLGPVFQVGFHYTVAGYDVYLGEIVITLVTLGFFGLISSGRKRVMKAIVTTLAICLVVGTGVCLVCVGATFGNNPASFSPPFATDGLYVRQVFSIVALAPWAFVGFESASHAMGEIRFSRNKLLPILLLAIAAGGFVYIATIIISVLGTPQNYASWQDYTNSLGSLDGLLGLPVFHAMDASAGSTGLLLLAFVVICAISTSLLGLYRAVSRLMHHMAKDHILPEWFSRTNDDGVPRNAILFIMGLSVVAPFVGRAAIGWIVDVTSISASIAYLYVSLCSVRVARSENNRPMVIIGAVGAVISLIFFVYPLVPNIWSLSTIATESYMILAAWAILGLVYFRFAFQNDKRDRFGKSTIVWIAMLFLIFFASTMWVRKTTHDITTSVVTNIDSYYDEQYLQRGIVLTRQELAEEHAYLEGQSMSVQESVMTNSLIQMALILLSLGIMFSIYALMRKRERIHDLHRAAAEQSSRAKTTFLSNMSHDIRTPMNAIIGYTNIAQREDTTPEQMRDYLQKIDASSQHLLALINDILEMSRIESGRMELEPTPTDLVESMNELRDMFATQMQDKNIAFSVEITDMRHRYVSCDRNRMNRVLFNLLSNAYKFTPEGGFVQVTLEEIDNIPGQASREDRGAYELRVRDSGIGMTEEFAEHVFDEFERERNSTVSGIQGTGLGMAITKSIVDLMGGTIEVDTALGKGTTFIIKLSFPLADEAFAAQEAVARETKANEVDFSTKRLLVVEDNEINLEIAMLILEDLGFAVDSATNGREAVDKVGSAEPGTYDAILMDIQMPVLNGYEATAEIRAMDDPVRAQTPIVACSANAFSEDVQASLDAGMNDHVAKPLDIDAVVTVLTRLMS